MKNLITSLVLLVTVNANSQISLANSKWNGVTEVPKTADIQLEFMIK